MNYLLLRNCILATKCVAVSSKAKKQHAGAKQFNQESKGGRIKRPRGRSTRKFQVAMFRVTGWTCACALLALTSARIYDKCELALDLQKLGVEKENIPTWVCIAYHESRFDTAALNPGSGDHGLLQISELYWCGVETAGKACGARCDSFRDDDVADDVRCALQIHDEHTRLQGDGFLAWVVYPLYCKHVTKKYLGDCDMYVKNTYKTRITENALTGDYEHGNVNVTYTQPEKDESPRFLSINSLLRGQSATRDWLSYKIDNIDELKLPVFRKSSTTPYYGFSTPRTTPKANERITQTTPRATTLASTTENPQRLPTTSKTNHISFSAPAHTKSYSYEKTEDLYKPKVKITTSTENTLYRQQFSSSSAYFSTTTQVPLKYDSYKRIESNAYNSIQKLPSPANTFRNVQALTPTSTTKKPKRKLVSFGTLVDAERKKSTSDAVYKIPVYSTSTRSYRTTTELPPTRRPSFTFTPQSTTSLKQFYTTKSWTTEKPNHYELERSTSPKSGATQVTQSIFDLYLHPTKRSPVQDYNRPSFDSRYGIKIFSGGTTANPLSHSKGSQETKSPIGSASRNQFRRETT